MPDDGVKVLPNFGAVSSVEVGDPASEGESRVRRSSLSPGRFIDEAPVDEHLDIIPDVLQYCAATYGSDNAIGWREVTNTIDEEKEIAKVVDGKTTMVTKKWTYLQLSDYKYISFVELSAIVSEVARGLVAVGVQPGENVNIFAQKRCAHTPDTHRRS